MGFTHKSNCALLVVDVQKGFDSPFWGKRNNEVAEQNTALLVGLCRTIGVEVVHIKHNSKNPTSPLSKGQPGNEFKDIVSPKKGEKIFEKSVNSAFIGTNLKEYLEGENIDSIVVAGLTSDHCVSTTVRMGANLGFCVVLAEDATATFDKFHPDGELIKAALVHRVSMASLDGEFAKVISTKETLKLLKRLT